jgi:hypothetical protein
VSPRVASAPSISARSISRLPEHVDDRQPLAG